LKIIKLDAIDSTNSFLKDLALHTSLENYYTVVTNNQTKGKGQQNTKWHSKPFKNATFSTFLNLNDLKVNQKKYLNFAVSLAIFDTLSHKNVPKLSIKWPNDIMSANKKICGILIENTFIGSKIKNSVVGIGLNVNQESFPDVLQHATSMKLQTNINYNLEELIHELLLNIKHRISALLSKKFTALEEEYIAVLYKKNIPTMFKDSRDKHFMGKITGISVSGNLMIALEDETVKEFGLKEVSFL